MESSERGVERLGALLQSHKLPFGTEKALQDSVAILLIAHEILYEREARCEGGVVDFAVHPYGQAECLESFDCGNGAHGEFCPRLERPAIGIECKVDGSAGAVLEQLLRYEPHVDGLILVTSRASHRFPPRALNLPFRVVWIAGRAL